MTRLDESTLAEEDRRTERTNRHYVHASVSAHGTADTPYGKVVQTWDLGTGDRLECVNPCAWLYYMCIISASFRALMQSVCEVGKALRVVIYNDSLVPGNPFRPDKGRVVETFYWAFADWPDHVLVRSFCWPVFALVRKSIVAKVVGGLSGLAV